MTSALTLHGKGENQIDYLTKTVNDNQRCPQEVAAGWIFTHDVLVPQLDGNQGSEKLTQLLYEQIKLPLKSHTQIQIYIQTSQTKPLIKALSLCPDMNKFF